MVQSLTLSLNPQLILKPILLTHKKPFKRVPEASEKDCQKTFFGVTSYNDKSTQSHPAYTYVITWWYKFE